MAGDKKLLVILESTLGLSTQFISSLSLSAASTSSATPRSAEEIDNNKNLPLPLLSAAAQTLKSNTGKISLFAINTPFTPSAITSVLAQINDSALPSLVTAAFLLHPEHYTKTFHAEINTLVKSALREYIALINDIKKIAVENGKSLADEDRVAVTTSAGRVWKVCDQLVAASTDGVVGVVIQKANEFLELVRDGIKELEEWNPEESDDDDWGLVDDLADETKEEKDEDDEEDREEMVAMLSGEKKDLLRLLTPIAKLYTAVTTQRLKPLRQYPILPKYASNLDKLMDNLKQIPDLVDEAAGSLYEHDIQAVASYTSKLKSGAISTVEIVKKPWYPEIGVNTNTDGQAETEDKFSKWATVWLKVLNELGKPDVANGK
ncbi:hypothetical protein H112_03062 [Trichophyton rubrum D6]|uniref:Cyclin-D1-binding protein 1-like N-terminal domain-containing protein n=3 Tax=Trichophyton rubrum TaxID=5551 RepID=A0A178EWF4_TRIRU|nr:uncharacterized protein TERG_05682 [Trichophyton rubrum CBS 118892]EZF24461.1 hypothetical protein H100_03068 [Trichophyton rubrum MR850]EZF43497.1 hypothetical protein H102_03061 [Trichophyton rubrum CBS 100081]EZF54139.1 hypothetical protein H103_03075 [Trichophyton rubrum CBS 288.86]EZF64757.1 hypothetical protein H104_03055 [Trichophyton rubrum CBS 289.86]EZF86119.1 hypothetical protein H110_03068 [Trichophyton rubrum MR1448]EZF96850.1 hypothetical protein H113_03076 [Trichophyton rubr